MSLNTMADLEPGYHESLLNATVRSKEDSCEDEMKELALEGGDASYTNFGEEVVDWSRKLRGGTVNQSAAKNADTGFHPTAKSRGIILVMGETGSGKSSFINLVTGGDVEVGRGLKSSNSEVNAYNFESKGCSYHLLDTPGFEGVYLSDAATLRKIACALSILYRKGHPIAGIIYISRITDKRLTTTSVRNLSLLEAMCGKAALSHLVLVTSMWDLVESTELTEAHFREEELTLGPWSFMVKCGSKVVRHNNTQKSALQTIDLITSQNQSRILGIQRELISENLSLNHTSIGRLIREEFDRKIDGVEVREIHLQEIERSYQEAIAKGNDHCMQTLKEGNRRLTKIRSELEVEKNRLRVDIKQLEVEGEEWFRDKFHSRKTDKLSLDIDQRIAFARKLFESTWQPKTHKDLVKNARSNENEDDHRRSLDRNTPKDNNLSLDSSNLLLEDDSRSPRPFHGDSSQIKKQPIYHFDFVQVEDRRNSAGTRFIQNSVAGSEGSSEGCSVTDPSLFEDSTDWEDESDLETYVQQVERGHGIPLQQNFKAGYSLVQITLEPMKEQIVGRLMEEFWIIFNQKCLSANTRQCPSTPSKSDSTTISTTALASVVGGSTRGKLVGGQFGDGGGKNFDNDPDEGPSGNNKPSGHLAEADQTPAGFACPYRKHNPRKYCIAYWRSCALSPLKTIARVKGHLYKYHAIHQCQRCKRVFESEENLNSHIETSEMCDPILAPPVDGITRNIKAVLQCKRKAFPGQTESERWKQIYQVLFPNEEIPDPYFEPVRDSEESRPLSPELTNIAHYEHFLRHNLPRLVRTALVTELDHEIEPIEERLREQLPDLVDHALNRAFLDYHTMVNNYRTQEPSANFGYASTQSGASLSQVRKGKGLATDLQSEAISVGATANLGNALETPTALLLPFFGTNPTANSFESTEYEQQSFENTNIPRQPQFEGLGLDQPFPALPAEGFFASPFDFSNQPEDLLSNSINLESFDWEFPLSGDSSSKYM